ncbi:MAG TPA: DUF2851 family protein [Ktedonobacteraceae bacterium]|jgi:hypothetical protein|nr:DUF2851 family protein [Ktedonobacteraceae bacterium]
MIKETTPPVGTGGWVDGLWGPCACPGCRTLREAGQYPIEIDLASRWFVLTPGTQLQLIDGTHCELIYSGRPGGQWGPDIHDAVLSFSGDKEHYSFGDVEFHIRASDWYHHQHHLDTRYNNVILHVVLIFDTAGPILRQDGSAIPVCSLNDPLRTPLEQEDWPCHLLTLEQHEFSSLLQQAGMLRFEQKVQTLLAQLQSTAPIEPFSAYDACLIPALAESFGYGRDRALFRAAGLRLIGQDCQLPEPSGRALQPAPLDAGRLRILSALVEQWRDTSLFTAIRNLLSDIGEREANASFKKTPVQQLRSLLAGLSMARADIAICNVMLPFAAAVAHLEHDTRLLEQARSIYQTYPKLASNSVTRAMTRQLQLSGEPKNACQQQGLHFIYAQTCREKRCLDCMLGGRP